MNPLWACGTTLLRALVMAGLAVLLAMPVRALLARGAGHRGTRLAWGLLLAPFLTPALVVGYAFANFALAQVRHPVVNEVLYLGLVTMRLVPVAALMLRFAPPPPVSAEALHCLRLTRGTGSSWSRLAMHARGPARTYAAAFGVAFLFGFQEFEIASLMNIKTWAVWLFDAQAGGLALSESLRYAILPLIGELLVLVPVGLMLLAARGQRRAREGAVVRIRLTPRGRWFAWAYLTLAALAVTALPAALLLSTAFTAFRGLFENFPLTGRLVASVAFAGAAMVLADLLAQALIGPGRLRAAALAVLCLPGLLGPLLIALSILCFFQLPSLRGLYDTPAPLALALTLLLLAPAVLLVGLFRALRSQEALHTARLLTASPGGQQQTDDQPREDPRLRVGLTRGGLTRGAGRAILWDLAIQPQIWIAFVLFNWAYFDVTASKLLSPSDLSPSTIWLYDLMHYGRNAALSAMVCITVAIPVMLLGLIAGLRGVIRGALKV